MYKLNRAKLVHDYDNIETNAALLMFFALSVLETFVNVAPEAFSARFGILGEKLLKKYEEKH